MRETDKSKRGEGEEETSEYMVVGRENFTKGVYKQAKVYMNENLK